MLLRVRLPLLLLLLPLFAYSQDTVHVQTFTWDSPTRSQVFDFPNDPPSTYRKIWMVYNMRCHDAAVGNGNVGCREWDYSCNTFITDSTRVDSTRQTHPSHLISNFSGSEFSYTTQQTFDQVQYFQQFPGLTLSNTTTATIGQGTAELVLPDAVPASRAQFVYTAAELQSAGLTAGPIHALELRPTQTAQVDFLRIRIKSTSLGNLDARAPELDGFTEVFFRNTALFAGTPQRLDFYQPFIWDGSSNLLIELTFTREPNGQTPALQGTETGADMALGSMDPDFALHFSGAGTVTVPPTVFSTVNQEVTLAFWQRGTPENQPANTSILEGLDDANNRQVNIHLPWGNGQVYWDCGGTGANYDRINKQAAEADYEGKWNHWAFTKNTTTGAMKIYLNGNLWHSGTGFTRPIDVTKFTIGAAVNGGRNYYGSITDFQVWDRELDQMTIQDWMYRDITPDHPFYSNLVAFYPMDAAAGTTVTDAGPNGANATVDLPNWRQVRGKDLFKNFVASGVRPDITLFQGDAFLVPDTVPAWDMEPAVLNSVVQYGLDGTNLIAVDTQYLFQAGYRYVRTEAGMIVDSTWIDPEGTISISELIYFTKQPAKYEILSLVTPYGNGLNLGAAGKTFIFDVTDYAPILRGKKRMSIEMGGQNQEELDIQFQFIKGMPAREVLDIRNIWPFRRGQYAEIQNDRYFEPRTVNLLPTGEHFKLRSAITGHGQNGEFVPRTHYLNIDGGSQEFTYEVWKECADNPIYPQGGTWIFDRAGWCPGAATDVHEFDITQLVTAGGQTTIDYGVNGAFMSEANYLVSNQLVTYGPYQHNLDAALERIARPNSTDVEFERINPACSSPLLWVRNTGGSVINSLRIEYSVQGSGDTRTYDWSGTIIPDELREITLPLTEVGFWSTPLTENVFQATIAQVNGMADGEPVNNTARSRFNLAAVYPDNIDYFLVVKTNNNGSEYSYVVEDASGVTVLERTNMSSNTIYEDALDLPPGCYTMKFFDAGHDGLSFWFFPENGSGSLKFSRKISTILIPLKAFDPDFGAGVQYDFVIEGLVAAEEPAAPRVVSTFPNPVTDQLQVELRGFEGEDVALEVVDMQGRVLYHRLQEPVPASLWQDRFSLGDLPAGMYYLRVITTRRVWVKEIVRQ
ncbi:MAG: T9SS type A sorting domain-containing protein [Bacteroidetes bacterium]|nr:MAG: T9SS type A sorting domain-containing protein [Bacteroidota bacterium]